MVFTSLLGIVYTALGSIDDMRDIEFLWGGLTMCTLSISALLYLHLPKVRKKFAAPPLAGLD